MRNTTHDSFIEDIADAYRTGMWLTLDDVVNSWPVEQIYDVQDAVMGRVFSEWDDHLVGYKISVTSADDQALIDTDEPAYGQFASQQVLTSGSTVRLSDYNAMLLESELVIRALVDLSSSMDADTLAASVEVTGGLEMPSSRFQDWGTGPSGSPLTVSSLVLDNAVAGCLVIGTSWSRLTTEEFAAISSEIRHGDDVIVTGTSARVLGSPLNSLSWLLKRLEARGKSLSAGTIVSSGTFAPPQLAKVGTYSVSFGNGIDGVRVHVE